MSDDDELLTVPEVAKRLRVDATTVRRHISRGALRAVRVGAVWRVPVVAFNEFLGRAQATTRPAPGPTMSIDDVYRGGRR